MIDNEIAEQISPALEAGEQLLWCGKTVEGATWKERGLQISDVVFFVIWSAVIMLVSHGMYMQEDKDPAVIPFALLFMALGAFLAMKDVVMSKGSFAVTSRRLLCIGKNGEIKRSCIYDRIKELKVSSSARDVGFVRVTVFVKGKRAARTSNIIISGINDPNTAYKVLAGELSRSRGQ